MNINPNRPSDKEIIEAIKQGKPPRVIIAELGTHTQRITQIRKRLNEDGEQVRDYHERIASHYIFKDKPVILDKFIDGVF